MSKNNDLKINAQRLNLLYQERIACLTEMMDELKEQEDFDIPHIFSIVYQCLNEMELHLDGGGIFGIKDDHFTFYASRNIVEPDNYWNDLPLNKKNQILHEIESEALKEVLFWNYEQKLPDLMHVKSNNLAIAISLLCNRADDEKMYMILFRDKLNKPFISAETQLIKIISRIMGWHLNYEFTYQVLMYQFEKSFRRKIH